MAHSEHHPLQYLYQHFANDLKRCLDFRTVYENARLKDLYSRLGSFRIATDPISFNSKISVDTVLQNFNELFELLGHSQKIGFTTVTNAFENKHSAQTKQSSVQIELKDQHLLTSHRATGASNLPADALQSRSDGHSLQNASMLTATLSNFDSGQKTESYKQKASLATAAPHAGRKRLERKPQRIIRDELDERLREYRQSSTMQTMLAERVGK